MLLRSCRDDKHEAGMLRHWGESIPDDRSGSLRQPIYLPCIHHQFGPPLVSGSLIHTRLRPAWIYGKHTCQAKAAAAATPTTPTTKALNLSTLGGQSVESWWSLLSLVSPRSNRCCSNVCGLCSHASLLLSLGDEKRSSLPGDPAMSCVVTGAFIFVAAPGSLQRFRLRLGGSSRPTDPGVRINGS